MARVLFLVPANCFTTICNSSCRRADALFWLLWASSMQVMHIYIHAGKYTWNKMTKSNKNVSCNSLSEAPWKASNSATCCLTKLSETVEQESTTQPILHFFMSEKLVTHGWCCQVMLPDWDIVWCPWTTAIYGCRFMSWWLNLQNRFLKQLFLSKGVFCHFWVQALFFEINPQFHKLKVWCSGSCP